MKKAIIPFILFFTLIQFSFAQATENESFNRSGKILVETGYNIIGGYSNSTGSNLLLDFDGGTISSFGVDMGVMLNRNFALKFKLGLLNATDISVTQLTLGPKYYIAGKVPVEFGIGILNSDDRTTLSSAFRFGYAANLAENITLEPTVGLVIFDEEANLSFGISFGLFL